MFLIVEVTVGKENAVVAPSEELHVHLWEQRYDSSVLSYWSLN